MKPLLYWRAAVTWRTGADSAGGYHERSSGGTRKLACHGWSFFSITKKGNRAGAVLKARSAASLRRRRRRRKPTSSMFNTIEVQANEKRLSLAIGPVHPAGLRPGKRTLVSTPGSGRSITSYRPCCYAWVTQLPDSGGLPLMGGPCGHTSPFTGYPTSHIRAGLDRLG